MIAPGTHVISRENHETYEVASCFLRWVVARELLQDGRHGKLFVVIPASQVLVAGAPRRVKAREQRGQS